MGCVWKTYTLGMFLQYWRIAPLSLEQELWLYASVQKSTYMTTANLEFLL